LGFTEIPCMVFTGLNAAEELRWLIKDNGQYAQFEHNAMSSFFDAPQLLDMGIHVPVVFSDAELETTDFGGTDAEKTEEDDFEPAEIESIKTDIVIGDLFEIGGHRLLCGDSTDKPAVERLMGGKKADMVFTDPPYGISYSSSRFEGIKNQGLSKKRNKAEMIINDEKDFDPSFIIDLCEKTKEVFIWGYQYFPQHLPRGGMVVWNKKTETEADCIHGDFEVCWSKQERNKMFWHRWGGFQNKEKGETRLHTTQKPVALPVFFFKEWGKENDLILDLFLGSGTTMVASEKTGRVCFGMELDPKYCEVIVKRMIAAFPTLSVSRNGKDETAVWLEKTRPASK